MAKPDPKAAANKNGKKKKPTYELERLTSATVFVGNDDGTAAVDRETKTVDAYVKVGSFKSRKEAKAALARADVEEGSYRVIRVLDNLKKATVTEAKISAV